jgi:hypothetical protein
MSEIHRLDGKNASALKGSKRGKSSFGRRGSSSFNKSLSNSSLPGDLVHKRPQEVTMYNSTNRSVLVIDRLKEVYNKAGANGVPDATTPLDAVELAAKFSKKELVAVVEQLSTDGMLSTSADGSTLDLTDLVHKLKIQIGDGEPRVSLQQFHNAYVLEAGGRDAAAASAAAAAAAVGWSTDPHINELFDAMDVDSDGDVTKVEFVEFVRVSYALRIFSVRVAFLERSDVCWAFLLAHHVQSINLSSVRPFYRALHLMTLSH